MDYWKESISIAADECGLTLTEEQLDCLAGSVEVAHDNYGMAHGHYGIDNYSKSQAERELDKLKAEQETERIWILSTQPCKHCFTTGNVLDGWGRDRTCDYCSGKGRVMK